MTTRIAFFNNKGGVGKTTLVYHLAHMLKNKGYTVIVADLDPQANLTSMFVSDNELSEMWENGDSTIYDAVSPLLEGEGDIKTGLEKKITEGLYLLAGDLKLSRYEDTLSETWSKCVDGDARAFRVQTAFARILQSASESANADYILVDIGPNLGALNRATLIACDYVITPLSPDLFSWQGLKNFGGRLKEWHREWDKRYKAAQEFKIDKKIPLPRGEMKPLGYIVMRYSIRLDRPTKSFEKWIDKMPAAFRELIPNTSNDEFSADDPYKIATLKDYFSLMPMAQEARKPMFSLKAGDGVVGSASTAVEKCYEHFSELADGIIKRIEKNKSSDD